MSYVRSPLLRTVYSRMLNDQNTQDDQHLYVSSRVVPVLTFGYFGLGHTKSFTVSDL